MIAPLQIPASQVGGATPPLITKYRVLKSRRRRSRYWAIIERTRTQTFSGVTYPQVSYVVVRDWKPILPTITVTQLLTLDAARVTKLRKKLWCKASTAGAWHSSLSAAEAKFRKPPKW